MSDRPRRGGPGLLPTRSHAVRAILDAALQRALREARQSAIESGYCWCGEKRRGHP